MTADNRSVVFNRLVAGFALVFGVLTIVSGGRVLFGGPEAQAAAGNAVHFVLWFNFLSGLSSLTALYLWYMPLNCWMALSAAPWLRESPA